jgi:hypothetical protein
MSRANLVLACLRALEIEEAVISLDGSGDSGDAVFDYALTCAGQTLTKLPVLTVAVDHSGQLVTLEELAIDIAASAPDGNWYDNEGGYGKVVYRALEDDPDLQVEIDMTYRDEYEDDDPDFQDDLEDEGEASAPPPEMLDAVLPIVIDATGGV